MNWRDVEELGPVLAVVNLFGLSYGRKLEGSIVVCRWQGGDQWTRGSNIKPWCECDRTEVTGFEKQFSRCDTFSDSRELSGGLPTPENPKHA